VVVDAHKNDDRTPYLLVTTDLGKTWKSLAGKISLEEGYLNVVRADPKKKGMLYAGSERGVIYSTDAGATWQPLKLNLPPVRVTDLAVKDDDLVVGTNGRSVWIFDDLTILRSWPNEGPAKDVTLFSPRPVYRYRYSHPVSAGAPMNAGDNPPQGAILHYHLDKKPKGDILLKVLRPKEEVLRTLSSKKEPEEVPDEGAYSESSYKQVLLPTEAGLHRVVWDLRLVGAETIYGARLDSGEPRVGPLVNPGLYTIQLVVEGKTYSTKLEVKLEPRERIEGQEKPVSKRWRLPDSRRGTLEPGELEEQLRLAVRLRDEISLLSRTVEQLRSVRKQMQDRDKLIADRDKAKDLIDATKALGKKLDNLEAKLQNPKAQVAYDILAQKGGAQLYSQLAWLFELIKDADGAPTEGWREVHAQQSALLKKYVGVWQVLVKEDIARMNALAKDLDLPGVIVPVVKPGQAGHPAPRKRR
jgi:hypothetical protein